MTLLACLASSSAWARYSVGQADFRDFRVGEDFVLDVLSYQPIYPIRQLWARSMLEPGGPRGFRFNYGSISSTRGWEDNELRVGGPMGGRWSWCFGYTQGLRLEGSYRHIDNRLQYAITDEWYGGILGEAMAAKEHADLGLLIGRETVMPDGLIGSRVEVRLIGNDVYWGNKNDVGGRYLTQPLGLQLSGVARLGWRGWLSFDVDLDFPSRAEFGDNPDPQVAPAGEGFVFGYRRFEADIQAGIDLGGARHLWMRAACSRSARGRDYEDPSDPAAWDARNGLGLLEAQLWRDTAGGHQAGFGMQLLGMDERQIFENDADSDYWQNKRSLAVHAHYRRNVTPGFALTSSVWLEGVDRAFRLPGGDETADTQPQGKAGFLAEFPFDGEDSERGGTGGRLVLGLNLQLDRLAFGGGVGQFVKTF